MSDANLIIVSLDHRNGKWTGYVRQGANTHTHGDPSASPSTALFNALYKAGLSHMWTGPDPLRSLENALDRAIIERGSLT